MDSEIDMRNKQVLVNTQDGLYYGILENLSKRDNCATLKGVSLITSPRVSSLGCILRLAVAGPLTDYGMTPPVTVAVLFNIKQVAIVSEQSKVSFSRCRAAQPS